MLPDSRIRKAQLTTLLLTASIKGTFFPMCRRINSACRTATSGLGPWAFHNLQMLARHPLNYQGVPHKFSSVDPQNGVWNVNDVLQDHCIVEGMERLSETS